MKIAYGFYGAGGFGQQVISFFKMKFSEENFNNIKFYYIDDNCTSKYILGDEVVTYSEFLQLEYQKKYITITIANSNIRENISKRIESDGINIFSIIALNSLNLSNIKSEMGLILSPYSIISSNVKVGKFCHVGFHSSISHDCNVGNYVTIATGVRCNGNVTLEDHVYIGSGAVIKQGTPNQPLIIGKGAIVGMGAVVTKSVPPGVTVVGNPARILEKK